jgi:tetratricopeptide (TPR) repeat protein
LIWLSLVVAGAIVAPRPAAAALSPQETQRLLQEGLDRFYNLEYDSAIADFQRLRADNPRNPDWQNQLAMAYLYKQLYVAGALEGDLFGASNKFFRTRKIVPNPELENHFRTANSAAARICEQRLKQRAQDEGALYACGVAYAARATHQGLIERSMLDSLGSARRSNDYHTRLARIAPRNYDAYLIPGLYDFVLGSLPGPVKVLFFFAGLHGDKQRGIQLVESVAQWGNGARHDAQILLTVMYRREKRFADARREVESLARTFPRNYILPLEVASLHRSADEYPEAIRQYELVLERVRSGVPNYSQAPLARIHFELANLYEITENLEPALQHIQQVPGARGGTEELEQEAAAVQSRIEAALATLKAQAGP